MATQKVTFLSPQGIETTRDIESAEQISGFEKSGFKTVSNPFTTPTPNVASPTTQTPNYGGLTSVTPAEQDLVKQGYTPEQIELRRQQSTQGGRINIGQAGQAITSNLANYGIATSALPSIQSRADLMSAQEEAQIRANEEQRKQMLRQQIASDFQGVINRTEKKGEQQIGGVEAQLGISRGLGASSSRMQLVNQMQSDINRDIGELEKAKTAALAKLDFDSADRTEALINQKIEQRGKLQEEAFNQSMRLLQETREQQRFNKEAKEMVKTDIQELAKSGIPLDQLTEEERIAYEQAAGLLPGSFDAYYNAVFDSQQASNLEGQVKAQQSIVNYLKNFPPEEEIEIGGNTYSGMKEVDPKKGLYSFTETAANGEVYQIVTRYNQETDEMERVSVLPLGVKKRVVGSGGGGSSSKETYFTEPKEDGSIGYYYGKKGDAENAQELSKENYLQGVSQAQGVLTPDESDYEAEFSDYVNNLQSYGYSKEDAWEEITNDWDGVDEETKEKERRIFENVFGDFMGDKPGWG